MFISCSVAPCKWQCCSLQMAERCSPNSGDLIAYRPVSSGQMEYGQTVTRSDRGQNLRVEDGRSGPHGQSWRPGSGGQVEYGQTVTRSQNLSVLCSDLLNDGQMYENSPPATNTDVLHSYTSGDHFHDSPHPLPPELPPNHLYQLLPYHTHMLHQQPHLMPGV